MIKWIKSTAQLPPYQTDILVYFAKETYYSDPGSTFVARFDGREKRFYVNNFGTCCREDNDIGVNDWVYWAELPEGQKE